MIESFLGTILFCSLVVILPLLLIQFIAIKTNMKVHDHDVQYVGDYVVSFIIFFVASAIALLFYMFFYYKNTSDTTLYNSGLLFQIWGFVINLIVKVIYHAIIYFINLISKAQNNYFLKFAEMNWIMIFISIIYSIWFFLLKENTYSFSYFALALGYFLGTFTSKDSLKEIIKELKSLTLFYWCTFLFILICGFSAIRYKYPPLNIASCIGIIIGYIIGIMLMYRLNSRYRKHYNKSSN